MEEIIYHKQLVERYISKKASDEELIVFFKLLNEGSLDEYLADAFGDDEVIERVSNKQPKRRYDNWTKMAVAASVIAILSTGIFLFYFNNRNPRKSNDVLVMASRASYNQVITSRGEQRNLILGDGTKIWLGATSSLRYPKVFSANNRIVELEGEGYFEVAQNASAPFHVQMKDGADIQVIGTHFNIYAYPSEPIKATLMEGIIRVQSGNDSALLQPGQQVIIKKAGQLEIINADLEQAMAWKNGVMQFNRADVTTVMRQIERWYDVDVVYQGKISQKEFVGKISARKNINEVLQILELSNIHSRIEGREITILGDRIK